MSWQEVEFRTLARGIILDEFLTINEKTSRLWEKAEELGADIWSARPQNWEASSHEGDSNG